MVDKIKSSLIVFIILIMVSLAFAGAGFYLLHKEKLKNSSLQEELESLRIKQNATQMQLEEYKKTISGMELKIKDAQTNIDSLNSTLEQETKSKQEALTMVAQLKSDLEQQNGLKSDLEKKVQQMQKDTERLQAQLKETEKKKTELEEKIKALETQNQQTQAQGQGVELGTIVVGQEGKGAANTKTALPLEGKVLVVNKEYNFAVINLGSKDGVKSGDVYSLYHGKKYIGDIKVEKIHDSMSAADFVSASIKDAVSEGDRVVQKVK